MYVLNPLTLRLNYAETPRKELREFFRRFITNVVPRTETLPDVVCADDRFASWTPDVRPASLEPLGAWFMSNVHTRPRTEAEIFEIASKNPYPLPVPPRTLTDETFSLAADVGIYFARVLMRLHPELQWTLSLGSKNFVDYGQSVIQGFRGGVLHNPVRIATNVAYGISSGKPYASRLRQLIDAWSANAQAE